MTGSPDGPSFADLIRSLAPVVVDQQSTAAAVASLKVDLDSVEPIPDVDACPKCGMSFVSVAEGVGLTFPMKVICTCTTCNHEWERLDE